MTRAGLLLVVVALTTSVAAARQLSSNEPASRSIDLAVQRTGAVSPDGRFFAFKLDGGFDLVIRDLSTGATRPVVTASPDSAPSADVVWSPDSQRILYRWGGRSGAIAAELRSIRPDGSGLRVEASRGGYGRLVDWSRDTRSVLLMLQPGGGQAGRPQPAVLSLADGAARMFPRALQVAALSPDGRFLVRNALDAGANTRDIHVVAVDGGRDHPLIASAADEYFLGWSPDGTAALYMRDGEIYLAAVSDGQVQGPARQLRADVGAVNLLGITHRGDLYYGVSQRLDVFQIPLDVTTGKVLSSPARVGPRANEFHWFRSPVWSPDGRELAYKTGDDEEREETITIVSIDSGQRRTIRPEIDGGIPAWFAWSRDGRSFIVDGNEDPSSEFSKGAYRIDANDGDVAMVVSKAPRVSVNQVRELPDGQSVVYLETWQRIVTRNLETTEERMLYDAGTPDALDSLTLSPDGTSVAFRDRLKGMIQVMALTGDSPRTLAMVRRGAASKNPLEPAATIAWSPDGQSLIFSNHDSGETRDDLWRVPIVGGTPERLGLTTDRAIHEIAVQPSGQSIVVVMSDGEPPGTRVIEGLLPPGRP